MYYIGLYTCDKMIKKCKGMVNTIFWIMTTWKFGAELTEGFNHIVKLSF